MEDERSSIPEEKIEAPMGVGRPLRIYSSVEKPIAFRTILQDLNELVQQNYIKGSYRFPIFTQGKIVDVNEGSGSFHYFALVDAGQYLPCKIKDADYSFQSLQENIPVIVKGYFNLESNPNRPYAFEIRFNVIQLFFNHSNENVGQHSLVLKKPVPDRIRSVCLITSPSSEAISDFREGLKKYQRHLSIEIQGVNLLSPDSISAGIKEADSKGFDVLVITRGGGQDLYLFNDPAVVAAVAECRTYTISGIGHASNKTDCDRVADLCVETPTSAGVHIGRLVGAEFYTDKTRVLSPNSSIRIEHSHSRKNYFRRFLRFIGDLVFGFSAFVFALVLGVGKRILMFALTLLAGSLAILFLALLVRGCS